MDELHRFSNGTAGTLSDECAVYIKQPSGRLESGVKFFEFYAHPQAEKTRIEWTGEIAVIPCSIARAILVANYGKNITDFQLARWNEQALADKVEDDENEQLLARQEAERKAAEERDEQIRLDNEAAERAKKEAEARRQAELDQAEKERLAALQNQDPPPLVAPVVPPVVPIPPIPVVPDVKETAAEKKRREALERAEAEAKAKNGGKQAGDVTD